MACLQLCTIKKGAKEDRLFLSALVLTVFYTSERPPKSGKASFTSNVASGVSFLTLFLVVLNQLSVINHY
jgi:hypothetical protein